MWNLGYRWFSFDFKSCDVFILELYSKIILIIDCLCVVICFIFDVKWIVMYVNLFLLKWIVVFCLIGLICLLMVLMIWG